MWPFVQIILLVNYFVDAKNVTSPLHTLSTSKRLHEAISGHNRQCYFKHQILSESSENYKILRNSQKKLHMKLQAILTSFGLTSFFQQLKRGSGGDEARNLDSQNSSYGWPQTVIRRLYIKLQVIPTTFGRKGKKTQNS